MLKVHLPPKKPLVISLIVLGVLIAGSVPSYYFYDRYQKSQELLKNPTEAARQEVQALAVRVGKYIELPKEEPTVATVSDKDKLKDQPFFQKAENGDKVLIYTQARKAILYRPATDKIIEVGPINVNAQVSPKPDVAGAATVQKEIKVALYNGTTTPRLTATAEKKLKETFGETVAIVEKDNAKKEYPSTLVVAFADIAKDRLTQLEAAVGGQSGSLPQGESKPNADILIILGKDYAAGVAK